MAAAVRRVSSERVIAIGRWGFVRAGDVRVTVARPLAAAAGDDIVGGIAGLFGAAPPLNPWRRYLNR